MLPETLQHRREEPISLLSIVRGYRDFLVDRYYLAYLGIISFTFAGLFAWISGASFVLREIYGMDRYRLASASECPRAAIFWGHCWRQRS